MCPERMKGTRRLSERGIKKRELERQREKKIGRKRQRERKENIERERKRQKERERQVAIKSAIELSLIPLGVVLRFRLVLRLSFAAEVCFQYPPLPTHPLVSPHRQFICMRCIRSCCHAPLPRCPVGPVPSLGF